MSLATVVLLLQCMLLVRITFSSPLTTTLNPEPTVEPSPSANNGGSNRCPMIQDLANGILWPRTRRNTTRIVACPAPFIGMASRFCNRNGRWRSPDVSDCETPEDSQDGDTLSSSRIFIQEISIYNQIESSAVIMPTATITTQQASSTSSVDVIPTPPPTKQPPSKPNNCPRQRDVMFGIIWPETPRNVTLRLPCPPNFSGRITRFCRSSGRWDRPDIKRCRAETIDDVSNVSATFFVSGEEDTEDTMFFLQQLRNLTRPPPRNRRGSFLNRNDLRTINFVTRNSLRVLRRERNSSVNVQEIFGLFSNILDSRNRESWDTLQETESGSEEVLNTAEEYASLTASRIEQPGEFVRYSDENLAMRAERISIDSASLSDLTFPAIDDIINTTSLVGTDVGSIRIPVEYIQSAGSGDVSAAFMVFPTLQDFLPNMDFEENITVASVIVSAQILPNGTDNHTLLASPDNPIELDFIINVTDTDNFTAICVFWNFTADFNSTYAGGWQSDGISTVLIDNSTVKCLSTHLTSFAVLVDVSGTYEKPNATNSIEQQALTYISYIGCAISIVCLGLTVLFLLSLGNELFEKTHYFIHLNLALSLMFGFTVFIGGINYASIYEELCKTVAFLLHYFFLSAFCWMLCEAIMLYLLIVVVFTSLPKKWYLFMLIGWGLPLVFVGVSFGGFFNRYIKDSNICWLSYSHNVIWTFIAPMCLICTINVFVLIVVSVQLYRVGKKARRLTNSVRRNTISDKDPSKHASLLHERRETVKSLLKGIMVLLPLLGITWIIGIFSFNQHTRFFAWIFTLLNAFQGIFIFIFHVICSQKFQNTVHKILFKKHTWLSENFSTTNTTRSMGSKKKSFDSIDKALTS